MWLSPTGRRFAGFVVVGLVLTGCTSAPEEPATPAVPTVTSAAPTPSASSSTGSGSGSGSGKATPTPVPAETPEPEPSALRPTEADEVAIDITIADGTVDPNGKKIDVEVDQPIALYVTSDEDDEVHAYTSDNGYTLKVRAGTKVRGEFTLTAPGSYEVESRNRGKTIVILKAR